MQTEPQSRLGWDTWTGQWNIMLGLGWVEIFIILIPLALGGGWLWGVVSAAGFPEKTYRARGLNKTWVIVGVVLIPLAFIAYALFVRPRLNSFVAPRLEHRSA